MTTPEDDFYLKVAHALSGCQLVEEHLKLYITEALELVKKCVGDKIAFKAEKQRGRESLFANHFPARDGDLVHLVSSVCLVCLVRRTRETRQPRTLDRLFLDRHSPHTAMDQADLTK